MVLHALDEHGLVPDAHDLVLVCPGRYDKILAETLQLDRKRVVSGGREGIAYADVDAFAIVVNRTGLAVHEPFGSDDVRPEDMTDTLVSQANAKDRYPAGEVPDHIVADAGLARRAGAG